MLVMYLLALPFRHFKCVSCPELCHVVLHSLWLRAPVVTAVLSQSYIREISKFLYHLPTLSVVNVLVHGGSSWAWNALILGMVVESSRFISLTTLSASRAWFMYIFCHYSCGLYPSEDVINLHTDRNVDKLNGRIERTWVDPGNKAPLEAFFTSASRSRLVMLSLVNILKAFSDSACIASTGLHWPHLQKYNCNRVESSLWFQL
jgi:hypothetical protein